MGTLAVVVSAYCVFDTYRCQDVPFIWQFTCLPYVYWSFAYKLFPSLTSWERLDLAHFHTEPGCFDPFGRWHMDRDRATQVSIGSRV